MTVTGPEIASVTDRILRALSGSDEISAIRLFATQAEINLDHVNLSGASRTVIFRVVLAAEAQGKLINLLSIIATKLNVDLQGASEGRTQQDRFPSLAIHSYLQYIPSNTIIDDGKSRLFEGQVRNPAKDPCRVLLSAYVSYCTEYLKLSLDVPPPEADIPRFRIPRFSYEDAQKIEHTITYGSLTIELYVPSIGLVDVFQRDILISQPDVFLLAYEDKNGQIHDVSEGLAWWVNSGARGLREFVVEGLGSEVRSHFGYNPAIGAAGWQYVDGQIRDLYHGFQRFQFQFVATEVIWQKDTGAIFQRIRRPEVILNERTYSINCLDGAILFASLVEHMNLDPVIVLIPGHALVGWKRSSHPIKSMEVPELLQNCGFLDSTYISSGASFDASKAAAEGFLIKYKDIINARPSSLVEFAKIIDVKEDRRLPRLVPS